ncbi:MAG: HAMP domain-containing histidine kinase [Methanothrix sp.]|nr:HAMP domain-containing histidine kinase [Methanothrix sp.]
MKRYWPGLLAAGAFIFLGLGAAWLVERGVLPNASLSLEVTTDLTGLLVRAGLLLGFLCLVGVALWWAVDHRIAQVREQERQIQAGTRQQFLGRLDHELKNPLTIIRLGIVNLQQSPELSSVQASSITRIGDQVQRLQKLFMDLRLLSELDQRSLEHKPSDLKGILEDAISLAGETAEPDRKIAFNVQQTPWPVSAVWGDRDLLLLAYRNLLDNALKFSQPDGRVEVRVSEDGRAAIIEVADTGMGIPPDEIPLIFEELYRGQNARGIPGSGLGLKLVERIVALHAGTIRVRSKPGQGTVFTVSLPLAGE